MFSKGLHLWILSVKSSLENIELCPSQPLINLTSFLLLSLNQVRFEKNVEFPFVNGNIWAADKINYYFKNYRTWGQPQGSAEVSAIKRK